MSGSKPGDLQPGPAATESEERPRWRIERFIPGVSWMRAYQRPDLRHDLLAGVTLAAVILPIAMAYGQLAGLPPIAGVYASITPLLMYALFGPSRLLVIGPDTSTAALVAAAILPLAAGDSAHAMALAAGLAMLVGAFSLLASVTRLGFVADFLSKPILVGYINGLALSVIAGQLSKLFGVPITSGDFFRQIAELVTKLPQTNLATLAIGVSVLAFIVVLRRVAPRVPGPLIAVVGATVVASVFQLDALGVATIGYIPPGLPKPGIPPVSLSELVNMLPDALGITLLTFSDTILNARTFAARNGYTVDANQELVGLGAGNIAAGLTQGFAVSGSGTRTAVNEGAGGRTQLAGVTAAVGLGLILLFLTGPLSRFPVAALGGALIAVILPFLEGGLSMELKGSQTKKTCSSPLPGSRKPETAIPTMPAKPRRRDMSILPQFLFEPRKMRKSTPRCSSSIWGKAPPRLRAGYPFHLGDTLSNLLAAVEGENFQWTTLYQNFAIEADQEGFKEIAASFREIAKVEHFHASRYQALADHCQNGTLFKRGRGPRHLALPQLRLHRQGQGSPGILSILQASPGLL